MKQIIGAMNTVMKSCGYVQKSGKNAFHGYKYAGEADLLEKLRPAMVDAGLVLIPSVTEQSAIDEHGNTRVRIEYTLAHVSGEIWPTPIVAQGCGNDRNKNGVGEKGVYKAITGANKYLLFKLFQIETGDDPEASDPEPARKPTASMAPPAASVGGVNTGQIANGPPPSDWRIIGNDMLASVSKLKTPKAVNTYLATHSADLARLEKGDPTEYQRVKTAIVSHRDLLPAMVP